MTGLYTSSLEPNPSRTMTDPIHPEGIIPTGPYRDDLASVTALLQTRERELAELRCELQEKEELLAAAEDLENTRLRFYLGFGDDEVRRLEAENRLLRQQVISGGTSVELVLPNVEVEFRRMRKEVARTRLLVVIGLLLYLVSGRFPL